MAEGAQLPWKLQRIDTSRGPAGKYDTIYKPLPNPPDGLVWYQDKETRDYRLVPVGTTEETTQQRQSPVKKLGTELERMNVIKMIHEIEHDQELLTDDSSSSKKDDDDEVKKEEEVTTTTPPRKSSTTAAAQQRSPTTFAAIKADLEGRKAAKMRLQQSQSLSSSSEDDNDDTEKRPVEGVDYILHTVLPTDTLMGICLTYKTTALKIRQSNQFTGSNLLLAPSRLVIPLVGELRGNGHLIKLQDKNSKEYKMETFRSSFPELRTSEIRAYLEMDDWDLTKALESAREDLRWEQEDLGIKGSVDSVDAAKRRTERDTVNDLILDAHMAVPATTEGKDESGLLGDDDRGIIMGKVLPPGELEMRSMIKPLLSADHHLGFS